jgi:hypothetical protein
MAVRQLVTGSDVCAPSDGGGDVANAASALADQLLGRTGKAQEKLREVPMLLLITGPYIKFSIDSDINMWNEHRL